MTLLQKHNQTIKTILFRTVILLWIIILIEFSINKSYSLFNHTHHLTLSLYRILANLVLLPGVLYFLILKPLLRYISDLFYAREKYQSLIQETNEAFALIEVTTDKKGHVDDFRILEVNKEFERQTGLENVVGLRRKELDPKPSDELIQVFDRIIQSGNPEHLKFYARRLNRHFDMNLFQTGGRNSNRIAVLFTDVSQNIKDQNALKVSEINLRKSTDLFFKLFKSNPNPVLLTRVSDSKIITVNEAYLELLGYREDEILEHTHQELNLFPDYKYFETVIDGIIKSRSLRNIDIEMKTKNGRTIDVLAAAELVDINGEECILASFIDITRRKKMEEELIKSEERFYKAFNNNPNPFAITRARDYKVVDINEAFLKLLEFKREEVIGNYLQNLTIFPGERRQALTSDLLKLEKIEIPETEIRTKSGKILFASVYSQVIDLEGERHILTNLIDITERKKSEEALRINKERFRALTMASSQTIYRMSPDWKIMYSTTGGDTFKPASVETSNWLKEYVPKEEHEKVFSAVNKAVESKTMFELEHKVIRFDGSVGWTYSRAIPLINEKGEITEWFGAANEITVQKESEEALKKSEERFKKAFESNPNPATITRTSDFKIIGVNAAFLHLFEFTRDEVIGNTYIDLDLYPQSTRDKLLSTFLKNKIIKSTQVDVKTNSGKILNMLVSGEIIHFGNEDHMLVNFVDITHQKQAEEALKISEERFSKAFLNGPFGAIMAHIPDYRCVEVNSTFLELFDFKREEVIGHTSLELNIFQEKDRSEIISLIERGGSVHYRELDMQTKTGQTINVLFSVQKLLIGNEFYIFSSYVDITARKRAEEDLYQSEQRWITTLSSLNEAVIATDQQGKVTFLNLEAECLMGWAKNEVMNLPVHDFYYTIHEDTKEPLDNPVHKILAEGKSYHEKNHKLLVRKQGEQIPIEESGAPIRDWNGNPTGTVLIFHDISEQKLYDKKMKEYSSMLEERVKERTYELELAKEQAESADRLKTSFLLTMSHELRTPLNSIIGFSGILHKEFAGPLNEEQKKQINMISSSGRHLLHLVNDILDMSKLEVGQLVVQIAPFEVEKVIDHVLEIEKPFAEDKGIEIKVIKPDEMIIAESDAARFQQVILNLVHNALKFTDEGFVSIEYGSDKDKIWIRVADTGIGIKEEKISRLFVSFAQIQDDDLIRRHQGTGSGLGLAISKKIMELLHGSITVQSKYGEGSIFTVTLAQEKEVKRRA